MIPTYEYEMLQGDKRVIVPNEWFDEEAGFTIFDFHNEERGFHTVYRKSFRTDKDDAWVMLLLCTITDEKWNAA